MEDKEKTEISEPEQSKKPKCHCDKCCLDCNADAHIDGGCKCCPLYY